MSFSIVTVALNAADDLALTFESIIQQEFDDFEFIYVDGGSWDDSARIIEIYSEQIAKVVRVQDAGIFYAMNEAVHHCSKEYILFMNAKDRFFNKRILDKIWKAREGDPDIMFGDHVYVNGRTETLTRAQDFNLTRRALRRGNVSHKWHSGFPCHQATFTRASLLKALPYDTRLEICADHDFLIRAYDSGAEFQYIDEVVCHYMGGGYSSMRSERCKMEFAYVYRRYSRDPMAVDRLFYANQESPFSNETRRTGMIISSIYPREGPYPEHGITQPISWLPARGVDMLSPFPVASLGITLEGFNNFEGQILSVIFEDRDIGHVNVREGAFIANINFSELVPAQSILHIRSTQYGALTKGDGRFISVAISAFQFDTIREDRLTPLTTGEIINFRAANAKNGDTMLLSGWSHQEVNHVWSIGSQSYMQVAVPSHAASLWLCISGNPYVPEADRAVSVAVNGRDLGRFQLVGELGLVLDCRGHGWVPGAINLISLRPVAVASPPGDPRLLGVCLHALEVRDALPETKIWPPADEQAHEVDDEFIQFITSDEIA